MNTSNGITAPYAKLKAWEESHRLALLVYEFSALFPREERFGITSQLRRSAVSVAANIAEGSAKKGSREKRRFFDISLGSLSEVSYFLLLARDLGMLAEDSWETLDFQRDKAGKLLWGLYRANLPK